MPDLSKHADAQPAGPWFAVKKFANRLQDWFVTQSLGVRLAVLFTIALMAASSIYSITLLRRHAALAARIEAMTVEQRAAESLLELDERMPVVIGAGSLLGFVESNPVDRVTIIYKALMWDVSERIILVQSGGRQFAYYPSDMETKIFADKAVNAPWGNKLVFIPRSDLSPAARELMESLDQRFAGALPQSGERPLESRRQWRGAADSAVVLNGFHLFPVQGSVQVDQVHRAGSDKRLDQ